MATTKKPAPATPVLVAKKTPAIANRSKTNWTAKKALNRSKTQRAPWTQVNR